MNNLFDRLPFLFRASRRGFKGLVGTDTTYLVFSFGWRGGFVHGYRAGDLAWSRSWGPCLGSRTVSF